MEKYSKIVSQNRTSEDILYVSHIFLGQFFEPDLSMIVPRPDFNVERGKIGLRWSQKMTKSVFFGKQMFVIGRNLRSTGSDRVGAG